MPRLARSLLSAQRMLADEGGLWRSLFDEYPAQDARGRGAGAVNRPELARPWRRLGAPSYWIGLLSSGPLLAKILGLFLVGVIDGDWLGPPALLVFIDAVLAGLSYRSDLRERQLAKDVCQSGRTPRRPRVDTDSGRLIMRGFPQLNLVYAGIAGHGRPQTQAIERTYRVAPGS
jgi:hypothetical protein